MGSCGSIAAVDWPAFQLVRCGSCWCAVLASYVVGMRTFVEVLQACVVITIIIACTCVGMYGL